MRYFFKLLFLSLFSLNSLAQESFFAGAPASEEILFQGLIELNEETETSCPNTY